MKAWTLVRHGDPERVFELRDHVDPRPATGQVSIQSEGFGINYADTMAAQGLYREAPPLPSVIGYEVVGRIDKVGPGVSNDLVGKRVAALTRFGGYAQIAVTDHRACGVIEDDMPLGEALALVTQGCTAWYAARILCPLRKGERVLVHSAAGGVGHLLVQLAVASGCEVFAVVGGPAKEAFVRKLGAAHVIDRHGDDYTEKVRKLLGEQDLDVSFNAVGGASFKKDLSLLGTGGRLVMYGGAERGGIGFLGTLRFVWRMGVVVPILLMVKSRSLLGINMLRIGDHKPELLADCLQGAVRAYHDGILHPHVHDTLSHQQLPFALKGLAGGNTMGKVALRW